MGRPALTNDRFIRNAKEIHGDRYEYHKCKYTKMVELVTLVCRTHGDFEILPYNHTKRLKDSNCNASGCPSCGKLLVVLRNREGVLDNDEFVQKSQLIHDFKYGYPGLYSGYRNKVEIECSVHGSFNQYAGNHLKGSGCPRCKNSKGANKISTILNEAGLVFEREREIDGCRGDSANLRFDFWVPSANTLIEFDGEQHFKPVRFSPRVSLETAAKMFQNVQRYDAIKNDFCKRNNIRLIRIAYNTKDIKNALSDIL